MLLNELLKPSSEAALAGPMATLRGLAYFEQGRVEVESISASRLRAVVRGSRPYAVDLWLENDELMWACSCPAAEDGSFCKHCVAAARTLTARDTGQDADHGDAAAPVAPVSSGERSDALAFLADHVGRLSHGELVEIVLTQAKTNRRLRDRLVAAARQAAGSGVDLKAWRRQVDAAFAPYGDFVPYREAAGWAAGVEVLIEDLSDLCENGHPDAVAALAEHAHRRADAAVNYVDDSDGYLQGISSRLAELHLESCIEGSIDPVELAGRLLEVELGAELDGFYRAAADYADVLGPVGLAEYRRLLEPRWQRLVEQHGAEGSTERFRIREAMIGWALATGDPDELIAVRQQDLRLPEDYLQIARVLAAADRMDEAIDWARRGLAEHADRAWQTPPLREFLADALRNRGKPTIELFWEAFDTAPSLDAYRRLIEDAGDEADRWKARSIEVLRTRPHASAADTARGSPWGGGPARTLIEVLVYEGDIDGAWDAATTFGATDGMWMTLARAREASHPLDAINVYEREALALIDRKKNETYRAAVDLLDRIRRLANAAGHPERFTALNARVGSEHKTKRNLQALIAKKHW